MTGIAVGLKKGFAVEKRECAVRPSQTKRVSFILSYLIVIFLTSTN